MGTTRTFFKNSAMITLSVMVNKLLSFVFFLAIVRYLGNDGFGKYSFVFAFMTFFTIIAGLGLDGLTVREVARDRSCTNKYLVNTIALKTILVAVSWLVIFVLVMVMGKDRDTNLAIGFIALGLLPDTLLGSFKNIFSGHERMEYNTIIEIVFRLLVVALGFGAMFLGLPFIWFFVTSCFASFLTLGLSFTVYRRVISSFSFELDPKLWKEMTLTSLPFLLNGLFITLYFRIDTVMLSFMKNDAVVGWYNAAHSLTDALLFIPAAVNGAIYPIFSRLHHDTRAGFELAFTTSFRYMLYLALPIAVGTTFLSADILRLFFPPEYTVASFALQALIWSVAVIFLNALMSPLLYSAHRQKLVAVVSMCMAIFNVLLNLAVIPRYSFNGASVVTAVTEIIGFAWMLAYIKKHYMDVPFFGPAARSGAACIVMGSVLWLTASFHPALRITAGAAAYAAALVMVRAFNDQDRDILRRLLPQRSS